MQDFIDAVVFGFKEVINFRRMRVAIIGGAFIFAFWIIVGVFFWDAIVSVSAMFLDLVPFTMIRSNGAWMLSIFIWLQLVLVTFALVFAFVTSILLSDQSNHKYGSFAIYTAFASAIFWFVVWFFQGDYIYAQAVEILTWFPFQTIEKTLAYLIGFYFIYSLIILSNLFFASTLSNKTLLEVKEKHFPYDKLLEDNEIKTIGYTLKDTAIFIGISIIAFPLLFIPILNFMTQIVLWVWLLKDTSAFDSASLLIKEVNREKIKEHKVAIWGISILGAIFNFVPVFNIFAPYFTEISMFYYFKEQKNK